MRNVKIHSIRYNFIMNFILNVAQFIFPLITFPYISRVLQVVGSGKVSFAATVANYFMMVASLGIPTYGIRACAQVRNDKEKLSKTVHEIYFINLIMTILVYINYMILVTVVPRFSEEKLLFYINGITIVLNMFGMTWLFQAMEQYDYITFRSIFFKLISIILMFLFVHKSSDYVIYAGVSVFAGMGSYVFNFIRIKKIINFKWYGKYNLRHHLKPIIILFAQSLAVSIYTNLDTVMLGFIKTDIDVGYYHAATKVKTILASLVSSFGNVLLPRMTFFIHKKMEREFQSTMLKALNISMFMSMPLVTYFIIYARESIIFLAGNRYIESVLAMQIITISVIPIGITGILGSQVLTALEKEKYVLFSVCIGAVIDFILNLICIPDYGAAGASFATMITELVVLLYQVIYTKNLLIKIKNQIHFFVYFLSVILAAVLSMVVKVFVFKSVFIILFLTSCIFFGTYLICMFIVKEPIVFEIFEFLIKKLKIKKQ